MSALPALQPTTPCNICLRGTTFRYFREPFFCCFEYVCLCLSLLLAFEFRHLFWVEFQFMCFFALYFDSGWRCLNTFNVSMVLHNLSNYTSLIEENFQAVVFYNGSAAVIHWYINCLNPKAFHETDNSFDKLLSVAGLMCL